jgi:hypothetical protein
MFGKDKRLLMAALALLVLVGCAGGMEKPVAEPSAMAPKATMKPGETPAGQPAATLKPDALDAPAATSVADAQRSAEMAEEMAGASSAGSTGGHEGHGGHGGHGGGTYVHVDAGREMGAQEESHDHHGHTMAAGEEAAEAYVCPMHPEVTSATPGKCPKCGMDLVKEKKE